jgi:maltose O-acetyltransferase
MSSSPSKSEKEKMISGELYNGEDPVLVSERVHSAALLHKYNSTPHPPAAYLVQLKELLGTVGEHSVIRPPFFVDYGYNIHIGSGVFLNFNCVLLDVTTITIGDRTQIGPFVQIYAADHPRDSAIRRANLENGRPVHIGGNVWIGGGAVILPGVTIGDDAIIGAGSIVTRDVPAGATVVGNPARIRM